MVKENTIMDVTRRTLLAAIVATTAVPRALTRQPASWKFEGPWTMA